MHLNREPYLKEMFSVLNEDEDFVFNRQIALEFYENYFNIHDFHNPKSQLDAVAFHPKEMYFTNSTYENRLRTYMEKDILKLTGITFDKFLDLPTYEIAQIMKVAEQFNEKKYKIEQKAARDAKKKDDMELQRQNKKP